MIDFSKFEKEFPADKMKKDLADAKENSGNFDSLPEGEYKCNLEKLELGESQKGQLMLKAQFRIIDGSHKKQCIFKNCVLTGTKNDGFMLHKANEFLESLDSGEEITFESWEQYNDLILDVFDAIKDDGLSYLICVSENEKNPQYQDIDVMDIYD